MEKNKSKNTAHCHHNSSILQTGNRPHTTMMYNLRQVIAERAGCLDSLVDFSSSMFKVKTRLAQQEVVRKGLPFVFLDRNPQLKCP